MPDLFDKYLYVGTTRAAYYLGFTIPQRAAPFMLQTRSVCASLVAVLQKCTAAVWRTDRGRGLRFRSFWIPKLFAEVFDRHQEPDDDGANDGFGPYLLPGKTQVIIGDVPHR
jgi:hypothetical protein